MVASLTSLSLLVNRWLCPLVHIGWVDMVVWNVAVVAVACEMEYDECR
jgi:hypothetical protein